MMPFPPASWFQLVKDADIVIFDAAEHYQKMSYRNRYYLASKEGYQLMSLPLEKGRNQRIPTSKVNISYTDNWQDTHWKTIQSLYANSPFFEYLDYQLEPFFKEEITSLWDWSLATIKWVKKFYQLDFEIQIATEYVEDYGAGVIDIRKTFDPKVKNEVPHYIQVFNDSSPFLTDCSIIDLICCEGKQGIHLL